MSIQGGNVSTNASALGGVQERSLQAGDFQTTFNNEANAAPVSRVQSDLQLQPNPQASNSPRLNAAGALNPAAGDPFRIDTTANLAPSGDVSNRLYMQRGDHRTDSGGTPAPTYVRVAGNDKNGMNYNAYATSGGIIGGGVAETSRDGSLSAAVTTSFNTTPSAVNALTLGGNVAAVPHGSHVGVYAGIESNQLSEGVGKTKIETGLLITSGDKGVVRADNLQPKGFIAGYRQTNSSAADGASTESQEVFVRANAASLGPSVSVDGELAVNTSTGGQSYTVSVRDQLNRNASLRLEATYNNNAGMSTATGALIFESKL